MVYDREELGIRIVHCFPEDPQAFCGNLIGCLPRGVDPAGGDERGDDTMCNGFGGALTAHRPVAAINRFGIDSKEGVTRNGLRLHRELA
ncbi:hypothetical protein Ade02nite_58650 [Paractinoplanes deccanensis]|uniref:Uncharacterized protein n=1 Tax=Paractinoplanes deccanensis TaxID=113561 RepID=A0ABQ3YB38_9ACTN|nr:hypothetical protein [Actinoplanes deccanensis]GID77224.1 hypothetical protein Ade02nite_58650 [Actinoplanes deccanensis]